MYTKDAIFYDQINAQLQQADIAFYQNLIPDEVSDICEVACGTGRILFSLAMPGRKLTGIDLSEEMLEVAREKQQKYQIEAQLFCDNMIDLKEYGHYQLIICGYNSLQHICETKELSMFLSGLKRNLDKNGKVLIDVFHPMEEFLFENGNERELSSFRDGNGNRIRVVERTRYDKEQKINDISYIYEKDGAYWFTENYKMRQYSADELDAYILQAGFEIVEKYGSYEKDRFTKSSMKQIYLLQMKQ